jgi:hypothetical protein
MGKKPGVIENPALSEVERVNRPYLNIAIMALAIIDLTSCGTTPAHQFSETAPNWQTKTGQLMYRTPQTTLIGDVIVRYSKSGDFELTVSKGPGVTLLALRQDATFAQINGPFARGGWSGPVEQAPPQLRGWLGVRDKLIASQNRRIVRYIAGNETFLFRF